MLMWLKDKPERGSRGKRAAGGDGPYGLMLKLSPCNGRTLVFPVSGVGEWMPPDESPSNAQRWVQASFLPWRGPGALCADYLSRLLRMGWA